MPTFYFNVCDGNRFDEAEEGRELRDVDAAREEAIRALRDIMAGDVCSGELNLAAFLEVEDESRQLLFTLSVEDAVQVKNDRSPPRTGRVPRPS